MMHNTRTESGDRIGISQNRLLNARRYIKRLIRTIITLIVLAIGFIYLYLNRSQLVILWSIRTKDLAILSILIFLFSFVTGYTFKLLVGAVNVKLSFLETVGLSILTNFGNYLGPTRPGAALKAMYLKSSRGLAYTKFTSVLAANTFLAFLMTGSTGLLLLLLLKRESTQIPITLLFVCVGLIVCFSLPFICKIPNIKAKGRITALLRSALEGFGVIRVQRGRLILICLTFLAQFLLSAAVLKVAFSSLGTSITFVAALVMGVFTSIANLLTITPNNLGIQEAVIAYLFTVTGFDFTKGIVGAGLIRVIHIIITFALVPVFAHYLLRSEDLKLRRILPW